MLTRSKRAQLVTAISSTPTTMSQKSKASKHDNKECVQHGTLLVELIAAFKDDGVVKALREATKDRWLYEQVITINTKLAQLQAENTLLRHELDATKKNVTELQGHADMLEQQGRKDSVRIFGIPENVSTPDGERDAESLAYNLFAFKMDIDISRDELEVTHRIGLPPTPQKVQAAEARGVPLKPRPILVKFIDRKAKAKVMARGTRAALKGTGIFVTDDLTQRRAYLSYLGRLCKREKLGVADTWVSNSKVFIKTEGEGLVREVKSEQDLPKIPPELLQKPGAQRGAGGGRAQGGGAQPVVEPVPPTAGGASPGTATSPAAPYTLAPSSPHSTPDTAATTSPQAASPSPTVSSPATTPPPPQPASPHMPPKPTGALAQLYAATDTGELLPATKKLLADVAAKADAAQDAATNGQSEPG